jgi:hypothetical protein
MQRPKTSSGSKTAASKTAKAKDKLTTNAKKALELKRQAAAQNAPTKPSSKKAGKGMRPVPNNDETPAGALEKEGHRPVLERSRKVR